MVTFAMIMVLTRMMRLAINIFQIVVATATVIIDSHHKS